MDTAQDREATTMRRAANRALVVLFVVGMAVPCLGTLVGLDTGRVVGENRAPAKPPELGGPLKQLPRQIDAWFDDHFGLRNSLVSLHSGVEYALFGVSSSRDVVIGRAGWLFYAADRIIENRRGVIPFDDEELRSWQARLEERRDWLATRGIRYVFMVAPEKSSLYAEFLPAALKPVGGPTRADQLFAWMREHSTVAALDFRDHLGAAKESDRLYHRTDTHWNDAGAFAAYRQLAEWLHGQFPALRPLETTELDRTVHVTPGGDLAGMLALVPYFSEERIALVPKTPAPVEPRELTANMKLRESYMPKVFASPSGEIASAVVVHDSYFQAVQPFLARHFRRSTFVRWAFPPEIIVEEKPDIVTEEMVERVLSRPGFIPASELAAFDEIDETDSP